MSMIVTKIIPKHDTEGAVEARSELEGSGYSIVYEGEADAVAVDATRVGHEEYDYGGSVVIVGQIKKPQEVQPD